MTQQRDIIEVVKELQEKLDKTPLKPTSDEERHSAIATFCEVANAFPSIASALLTKDEQLKIAREALEKYYGWMNGGKKQSAYGRIVDKALSRISSL